MSIENSGKPVVSIVTPMFNSALFIESAIKSVLAQSFSDWEMIIVDDCSIDCSVDLIREFMKIDSRIKLVELYKNSGAAVARNVGIKKASGRYIAFLDSDDHWDPEKLSIQIGYFRKTNAVMVYSGYDVFNIKKNNIVQRIIPKGNVYYRDLLRGCPIGCLTAIYDTDKVGKVYMPELRRRQDWGLWMRILKQGGYASGVDQSLATLNVHPDSLTANKLKATVSTWKLLRTEGDLGFIRASVGTVSHLMTSFLRKWSGAKRT